MSGKSGTACAPQVVVLDKLDYCSSLRNLHSVKDKSNFKVRGSRLGLVRLFSV